MILLILSSQQTTVPTQKQQGQQRSNMQQQQRADKLLGRRSNQNQSDDHRDGDGKTAAGDRARDRSILDKHHRVAVVDVDVDVDVDVGAPAPNRKMKLTATLSLFLIFLALTNAKAAEKKLSGSKENVELFDINKVLKDVEDGVPEFKRDPSQPYTLGPKISDWDQQRSEWLKRNPSFPNFIAEKKPRVLLVTGSPSKACESPVGDYFLLKAIKNKIDYCRVHGIEIFYNMALLDPEMSGFWSKLPLIRKLLLSHPEVEFLWWMDSDAMFTDMVYDVPWEKYSGHNLVVNGWEDILYEQRDWVGLNTGSFMLRNCQWSLDILDAWFPMGPKGRIREEAGKVLTRELKGRPAFEADDQSALVYLLVTERDKWGEKVFLEKTYCLHGYWVTLVDKYEEMMEKYRPGMGDHRWPLITHFVGCKPCAKVGDYPMGRCLQQMERAFNFGDNQILQMYGFTHKSLASKRVVRIRNETSKALDVRDDLGLLHPPWRVNRTY